MHLQPYQSVRRRTRCAHAPTPPDHSLSTVRLMLMLAAVHAACTVVATPIRPHSRRSAIFPEANGDATAWNGRRSRRGRTLPVHRSILAVDIEGSTKRTNPVKEELRQQVYRIMVEALGSVGIDDSLYDPFIDRGDGVLVLLHPADEFPKPLLLSRLIPALADLLMLHNSGIPLAERPRILRLRAVVHAGEVHNDGKGPFGEDLDVAFRLLDAPKFKSHLKNLSLPLALVVSDEIYRSVIWHGYEGIDGGEFSPIVNVSVAERRRKGWVHFPRISDFPVAIPAQAVRAC